MGKQVLFVASECHPYIKTGGLGDVVYALPKALRKLGVDARVIIPKYSAIPDNFKKDMRYITNLPISVGFNTQYCGIFEGEFDGIPFYFLDNEYYFSRPSTYGFFDEGERFSFFSKAVLQALPHLNGFWPDVINVNDWHTAMIPVLLRDHYRFYPEYQRIKTVLTIHNLRFQGIFPPSMLNMLELNEGYFNEDALKFHDAINYLKGGIKYSNKVSTVSRTYSNEIQGEEYGEGLHGLLQERHDDLWGIINGIDYDTFNPATDINLSHNYSVDNYWDKRINKENLQRELGLNVDPDVPVISIVSRLTDQKGIDLILTKFEELMNTENVQFVVVGTGEGRYENSFRHFAGKYPGRCSANILFNNSLAQRVYASSDMFLMPSRFEPCGLSQMIALRYGSIPIVRETGGLRDSVFSYNETYECGNGFTFNDYNADDMLFTIRRAIHFYWDKYHWDKITQNAMNSYNNWDKSAQLYLDLYNSLG